MLQQQYENVKRGGNNLANTNEEIRKRIAAADLKYWQVAEAAGISPYSFSIWLRHELCGERLARIEAAIDRLTGGVDVGASRHT